MTFTANFEGNREAAVRAIHDAIDAHPHAVRLYPDLYASAVLTALGWPEETPQDQATAEGA